MPSEQALMTCRDILVAGFPKAWFVLGLRSPYQYIQFSWNHSNDPKVLVVAGFSWLSPAASVGTTPCGPYVRQVPACR